MPIACRRRQPGCAHAVPLEQRRQRFDEFPLAFLAFEADMEVIDAGNGDHPHATRKQLIDNAVGDKIARRLHDDLDTALVCVLRAKPLDHLVRDSLTHRIEQRFAPRQDDAACLFGQCPVGLRTFEIAVRQSRGKVLDDAGKIALRLRDDRVQRAANIRPKTLLVAVPAFAMAGPRHDVVNGFHK